MSTEMSRKRGINRRLQINLEKLVTKLAHFFIFFEAVLIISTTYLFFAELRNEYEWLLVSLMVIASVVGIFLGWHIDGTNLGIGPYPFRAKSMQGSKEKTYSYFAVALGVATMILVIALNSDTGYITYFIGVFGGILVWILTKNFLAKAEITES